jgi:uncharacterized membrane protein YcaP (DUF421 family)
MFENFFNLSVPSYNLIIRATVVYLSILLLLRISGKRQIGQMGPTEFVAILLISNAVQNAMNAGDNSLAGGLILAAILIILSTGISYLTFKSKFFEKIFEGTPTLIVHHGRPIIANMNKERLSLSELKSLLRKQGIHDMKDVGTAVLEPDGSLSLSREIENSTN